MSEPAIVIRESPARHRDGLLIETHGFRHELQVQGETVSSLLVADYTMRIGATGVPMGGIVSVGTKEGYRNRGYSRRVVEHALAWMPANGFNVSILFGIDNYYHKYGYAVCLPECRIEVRTRDAERAESPLTTRPVTEEDRPALHAIYADNYSGLTGSFVRSDHYHWFRKGSNYFVPVEAVVFLDASGDVSAYAVRDASEEHVTVCEVGIRRPEDAAAIVRWAAECAIAIRRETVAFLVPPDGLFADALAVYESKQTLTYPRNGAGGGHILGMGRLLRLAPFLERMASEWTRRAHATSGLDAGTTLRLETDIGSARLRWTEEKIVVDDGERGDGCIQLPQWRLMQSTMGYHSPELILSFPEVTVQGDARLFSALFPRRPGYLWKTDQF